MCVSVCLFSTEVKGVCVRAVTREDGALLASVKGVREEGGAASSPGLPLPVRWAGRSERRLRHGTRTEPECS